MSKRYKHLTRRERDRIAVLTSRGVSIREVARELGRSPATISRELRRHTAEGEEYLPSQAHQEYQAQWSECHRRARLKEPAIRIYVRRKVGLGWSPEQIAGRLWEEKRLEISHEAIYQWIYAEARELIPHLPRAKPKRVSRRYRKHSRPRIPGRVSIWERPREVEDREQIGHWEVDTIHARGSKAVLVILTERKTRLMKLRYLPSRTALGVDGAIVRALGQYPRELRRTLTYDNGTENSQHRKTNATLGTQSYFCDPQAGWEKGTVENTIGLVRRYFPKNRSLDQVSAKEVQKVEKKLNNRPRKCLQFLTPKEAFQAARCT